MAFIPIPAVVRVQLFFEQQGQKCENVLHCRRVGGWTLGQMDSLAVMFINWWTDEVAPLVSNTLQLANVAVTDLTSVSAPSVEVPPAALALGAVATPALPMNVTVAVKWLTGLRGRSYRGRTYHMGLVAAQVLGSTLQATPRSALQTAYQALISLANTQTATLCVASYRTNGAFRTTGVATDVVSSSIDPFTDSQRRRLPGRGN